jgi:hypothetical protein
MLEDSFKQDNLANSLDNLENDSVSVQYYEIIMKCYNGNGILLCYNFSDVTLSVGQAEWFARCGYTLRVTTETLYSPEYKHQNTLKNVVIVHQMYTYAVTAFYGEAV